MSMKNRAMIAGGILGQSSSRLVEDGAATNVGSRPAGRCRCPRAVAANLGRTSTSPVAAFTDSRRAGRASRGARDRPMEGPSLPPRGHAPDGGITGRPTPIEPSSCSFPEKRPSRVTRAIHPARPAAASGRSSWHRVHRAASAYAILSEKQTNCHYCDVRTSEPSRRTTSRPPQVMSVFILNVYFAEDC